MEQIVYVETSIPSFYYEIRTEPEMSIGENGRVNGGINSAIIIHWLPAK